MQIGTVAFCGTGAATMVHHGGEHEWDVTASQVGEASYVCERTSSFFCLWHNIRGEERWPKTSRRSTDLILERYKVV